MIMINPKSKYLNPKQFLNSNFSNFKLISLRHRNLGFGICLEFRVSNLGFFIFFHYRYKRLLKRLCAALRLDGVGRIAF